MNLSQFVTFYEAGKYVYQLWNEMQNYGKEYIGEVSVKDHSDRTLKIKVCFSCDRQRYLKFEKIQASVYNHNQPEDLPITRDEWHVFFLLAHYHHDVELYAYAQKILNRLLDKAHLIDQKRSLFSSPTELHLNNSQVA